MPCAAGTRLQLHAGRQRRLVRRRRPRQIRRQRRHLGVDAAQLVGAQPQRSAATAADFADGKMNIPENKNRVPDLLDEARWELEFELKMQVPDGEKLAGMAHHKIHDAKWTQLSLGPHEDPMPRFLQPAQHGRDAEPGRERRAVRAHLADDRQGVRRQVPEGGRARLGGGKANPAMLRGQAGRRRRPLRRQQAGRRLLLGGGGAVHHDQEGRNTRTSSTKSEFFRKVEPTGATTPGCTRR